MQIKLLQGQTATGRMRCLPLLMLLLLLFFLLLLCVWLAHLVLQYYVMGFLSIEFAMSASYSTSSDAIGKATHFTHIATHQSTSQLINAAQQL